MTNHSPLTHWAPLATLLMLLPSMALAEAGDKIVRLGPAMVNPLADQTVEGVGSEYFLDQAEPPWGKFDVVQKMEVEADSGLGVEVGFEYLLTDLIGVELNLDTSRHDVGATFSGQIAYSPLVGEPGPGVQAAELTFGASETAPIIGGGAGKMKMLLMTAGANFHVLRKKSFDLYVGPFLGVAYTDFAFTSGEFTAAFSDFTSHTPLAQWGGSSDTDTAWGAVLGFDIPLGQNGWQISTTSRYMDVGDGNPLIVRVGMGHRF